MQPLNLESTSIPRRQNRKTKPFLGRIFPLFLGIILIFAVIKFIPLFWTLGQQALLGPGIAFSFLSSSHEDLKATNSRTNILLLGIGGANHDGPDLTDTMLVASVDLKTFDTVLISVPRDIWVDSLSTKINSTYAYGEENKKGGGKILAQSAVSEVLGIPIHYVVRIDFSGFKKAVDLIAGVDINVEKSFDDFEYPVEGRDYDTCGYTEKLVNETSSSTNSASSSAQKLIYIDKNGNQPPEGINPYACRFEHLHFDAGLQHMDGTQALRYVRSRKGTNGEGSDFARARRQQKLLLAMKTKILSFETLLAPQKLNGLMQAFSENIDTNIAVEEISRFYKLSTKVNFDKVRTIVLINEGENSLLTNPPADQYDGAWVLVPQSGSWDQIHQFVNNMIFNPPEETATPSGKINNQ